MTDERMALLELLEKEADRGLVREMPAFAAERPTELEVEAPKAARLATCTTHRKGCRGRRWETRAGRVHLALPKLRENSHFPSFL